MQYLKALVIGMGVLIVVCVGLLAYGLLSKTGSRSSLNAPAETMSPTEFGHVALEGHAGCVIAQTTLKDHRLVLRLDGQYDQHRARCQKTIVIDLNTGTVLGTVTLGP